MSSDILPFPPGMNQVPPPPASNCNHQFTWMDCSHQLDEGTTKNCYIRHDNFYCAHCLEMRTVSRRHTGPSAPVWWTYCQP